VRTLLPAPSLAAPPLPHAGPGPGSRRARAALVGLAELGLWSCHALASPCAAANPEPLLDRSECPALFGPNADAPQPAPARSRLLHKIVQRPDGSVTLLHSGPWRDAARLRLRGVELTCTRSAPTGEAEAILRVTERAAPGDCRPALYPLAAGDALSRKGRVLTVLDGALLLDWGGKLRHIGTKGAPPRPWKVVWRSTFKLLHPVNANLASKRARPARSSAARGRRR